ncbi:hypothetical protein AAG906_012959 [Vitis piasezkii]
MTDIVINIAATVAEYLVAPIRRQLRYLFRSWGVLGMTFRELFVKKRQERGEAEELMKDENKSCFNGWCPNLKSRYLLSRKHIRRRNFPHEVSYRVPLRNLTFKNYEPFGSRESILNEIMDALGDDKIKMIGVWGMGGVGKTTLVKQVAERAKQGKLFTTEVYIDVSWTRDLEKPQRGISNIQKKIAEMLGLKFAGEDESTRAIELMHGLKKQNILLILDDIWKVIDLEQVGIPCKDDRTACKVVLTSRQHGMLSKDMGTCKDFHVNHLCDEEAWKLFQRTAGDFEQEHELRPIATEGEGVAVWRNALQELRMSTPTNIEGVTENVYSCLEWSYKHLKSAEAKSLFLLIGSLGNGDIPLDDLLKYGMGLDLFSKIDSLEHARDRIVSLVGILKSSSLLLDALEDDKYYDRAPSLLFVEEETFFKAEVRVLSLTGWHRQHLSLSIHSLSNLRTLCVHGHQIEDIKILGNLKRLQILSLEDCLSFKGLEVMMELTDLRMLSLRGTILPSRSNPLMISSLPRLEHLCIRFNILKDSRLYLDAIPTLCGLKHLSCLRALELVIPFSRLLLEDVSFENLTRYDICVGDGPWAWCDDGQWGRCNVSTKASRRLLLSLGQNEWSQLNPSLHDVVKVPHFSKLFKTTEVLVSDRLVDTKHFINELGCDGFLQLKYLFISRSDGMQYIMNTREMEWVDPPRAFPLLERLKLRCLEQLEAVWHGRFPVGCFANLRVLEIEECDSLNYIIWLPTTQARESVLVFPQLGSLKLERLPNLINFYSTGTSGSQEPGSSFFNQVALPRLESLNLRSILMENIRTIWDTREEEICLDGQNVKSVRKKDPQGYLAFQTLNSLSLYDCTSLKYVFPASIVKGLEQLKDLQIHDCGVEYIVSNENGVEAVPLFLFPRLTSLTLFCLGHLRRFSQEKYTLTCSLLKKLEVYWCDKVIVLFQEKSVEGELNKQPLFVVEENAFPNLEELRVGSKGLVEIWRGQYSSESFGKLRVLSIENCDDISVAIPCSKLPVLQNLEILKVSRCKSVEEVIQGEELAGEKIPRLTNISLCALPTLMHLSSLQPILQNLHSLEVFYCENLRNLASPSMAKRLVNLKNLWIAVCISVKEIVRDDGSEATDDVSFTKLEKLRLRDLVNLESFSSAKVYIKRLASLTHLYKIIPGLGQNLQKLRILELSGCENLEILLTLSMVKTLEQLTVSDCDKVKVIVESEGGEATGNETVDTKLRRLKLQNLPNLKSFCSASYCIIFRSLTFVDIKECPQMEFFCQGDSFTPSLESVWMNIRQEILENDLNTIIHKFRERHSKGEVHDEEDAEEGDSEEQHHGVEDSVEEDTEEEDSGGGS